MRPIEVRLPSVFRHTTLTIQPKVVMGTIFAMILIGLLFAAPFLLWSYHTHMAGRLLESAIDWSDERQVDTLPKLQSASQAEQVLTHLHDAIYWQPNDVHAYRLMAYVYMAQEQWSDSIDIIDKAQTFAPTHRLLLWEEALVYEQLLQTSQKTSQSAAIASQLEDRLIKLWTELDINGSEIAQRGYEARERRRYDEALKWYTRAELANNPLESGIIYTHYIAELGEEEDALGSIDLLEEAIILDTGWPHPYERFRAWSQWGNILFEKEKYAEAEALLLDITDDLTSEDPGLQRLIIENYRILALSQIQLKKPEIALQSLQKAIEKNKDNAWAYANYGQLLYEKDSTNIDKTKNAFNKALTLDSENEELWQDLILFWRRVRQKDEVQLLCTAAETDVLAEAVVDVCQSNIEGESSSDWYFEYLVLAKENKDSDAQAALQQAIELDEGWFSPKDRHYAWSLWGRSLFELEEYDRASVILQKVVDELFVNNIGVEPIQSESLRVLALTQLEQGKEELALQNLEQAIEIDPENLWSYVNYGQLLYQLNPTQSKESAQAFEKALALQSTDSELWENLILFWRRERETEKANGLCQTAKAQGITTGQIKACQITDGISSSSDLFYEHEALMVQNDEVEALVALQKAVELDNGWFTPSDRYQAWYKWGRYLFENEDYAEAEDVLQYTVNLSNEEVTPTFVSQSYRFLGLVQVEQEKHKLALSNFEQAIEFDDQDVWPYIHYGQLLYQLDPTQITEAVNAFETALALPSQTAQPWQELILFWRRERQIEQAQRLCENVPQAIQSDVEDVCRGVDGGQTSSDLYFESKKLSQEGNQVEAQEALKQAIELDEGWFTDTDQFQAWSSWGRILFEQARYEEAEQILQQTLDKLYPGSLEEEKSESLRILALAQIELAKQDAALETLQEAIESDNKNLWALVRYGQLLYELDPTEVAQTRELFEDAFALRPDDVDLSHNLILFLRRQLEIEQVALLCAVVEAENEADKITQVCQATDGSEISGDKYFEYQALSTVGEKEKASKALEEAIELDEGWFDSVDRFQAWYQWGRRLIEQRDYVEAERVLQQAVKLYPEENGPKAILSEAYRFMALTQGYQGKQEDALENTGLSLELNENNIWSHLQYGQTLFLSDQNNIAEANEAFDNALSLQDTPNTWRNVIGFWVRFEKQKQVDELCDEVEEKEFAEELRDLCQ